MNRLSSARRAAAGQQYAIIVGLIGVVALAAVSVMGRVNATLFSSVSNRLTAAGNGTVTGSGGGGTGPTYDTTSCATILSSGGSIGNATYTIDPDGAGGAAGFQVACDMTTAGGGWTHIATVSDAGSDVWSEFMPAQNAGLWDTTASLNASGAPIFNDDYKNAAYSTLTPAQGQLLITEGASAASKVLHSQAGCFSGSFRGFIAGLTWRASGSANGWTHGGNVHLCTFTQLGVDDPVMRASLASGSSRLGFKWGEADGTQDTNKDRAMIYADTALRCASGGTMVEVDCPVGLGGFTNRSADGIRMEDANECRNDSPADCGNANQHYQLWVR